MGLESLSVAERLGILEILPRRGSARDLRVASALHAAVDFGKEESARISLTRNGERITWDAAAATMIDVDIDKDRSTLIRSVLTKLDASESLSFSQLGLYDRFVAKG